jgi:hypothetical protein
MKKKKKLKKYLNNKFSKKLGNEKFLKNYIVSIPNLSINKEILHIENILDYSGFLGIHNNIDNNGLKFNGSKIIQIFEDSFLGSSILLNEKNDIITFGIKFLFH